MEVKLLGNPILKISNAIERNGRSSFSLTWDWPSLRKLTPEAEVATRMRAIEPLLERVRKTYPGTYVLTNDEKFVPNRSHRHLDGVAGNLDSRILSENRVQKVPLEYGWGRLEAGPNRWSYLIELGESGPARFGREILGMSMNPICYNFLFVRPSAKMSELIAAMTLPRDQPPELTTLQWENSLLRVVGAIIYPKEETYLVIETADATVANEIASAVRLGSH